MNLLFDRSFIQASSRITQRSLLVAGLTSLSFVLPPSAAQPETLANNTFYNVNGHSLEIPSSKIKPVSNGYSLGNRANTEPSIQTITNAPLALNPDECAHCINEVYRAVSTEPNGNNLAQKSTNYLNSSLITAKNSENTEQPYHKVDDIRQDNQGVDVQASIQANDVPEPSFIPGILLFSALVLVGKIKLTK